MKQIISVTGSPITAKVLIPGSKSITNRALLLASLAEGVSTLSGILFSDDTLAFIRALEALGIEIKICMQSSSCTVRGHGGKFPNKKASIWCNSAGTAARFLLAACAASPGEYFFDATPQLRQRPLESLIKTLKEQGTTFSPSNAQKLPLVLSGPEYLAGGVIKIDGSETGQFISALLMTAPLSKSNVDIISEQIVSRPYVEMTRTMMAEFGVSVNMLHQSHFVVPAPQKYHAREYVIEPDLSTASYFFAAAAITSGEVTISGVDREKSKQGDIKFLNVLEQMGCQIAETPKGLSLKGPKKLQGINVDMQDFSDVFMTLAAIAPFAKTPTTITHIGHTRFQESNRIHAMCEGLKKLNVSVEEGPDWIRIFPSEPKGTLINSHNDHRIAMAFSILGLRVEGVVIEGSECVAKTCPGFFDMLAELLKA